MRKRAREQSQAESQESYGGCEDDDERGAAGEAKAERAEAQRRYDSCLDGGEERER